MIIPVNSPQPNHVALTLALQPAVSHEATAADTAPPPQRIIVPEKCIPPTFYAWKVYATDFGAAVADQFTAWVGVDNSGTPVKYPNGCWVATIVMEGCLSEADCLEFAVQAYDGFGDPTTFPDLEVLHTGFEDPESDPPQTTCNTIALRFSPLTQIAAGQYDGTKILVQATLDGNAFGCPLWFACDPTYRGVLWTHWRQITWQMPGSIPIDVTLTGTHTFEHLYTGNFAYPTSWDGLFWERTESVTLAVTQTAGTPLADPSDFQIVPFGCSGWILSLNPTTDFAGCTFRVDAMYAGNPIGDPFYWVAA